MKVTKEYYQKYGIKYPPGRTIFLEGSIGNNMYIIMEGDVEIRKKTSETTSKTLIVLKNGDIFGEMALIDKKERSASAIAVTPVILLSIEKDQFSMMIEKNPDFAKKMITVLSGRLRRADEIIQQILGTDSTKQIYSAMIEYASKFGKRDPRGIRINIRNFILWTAESKGFGLEEVKPVLGSLLSRNLVQRNEKMNNEIIILKPKS